MSIFTKLGSSVGSMADQMLGLANPDVEVAKGTNDRVTVTGTDNMTTVDQNSISAAIVGSFTPEVLRTSVDVPGSLETQGEKFYYMTSFNWSYDKEQLEMVTPAGGIDVFKELFSADLGAHGYLEYHTYATFGIELMVQMNPTPFQAGGLLAALIPSHIGITSWANLTTFPHIMLNCNINNMGRIKVPWVCTRGAVRIHDPYYPVWKLYVCVWSRLECRSGTTQSVSVVVLGRFTDLDLHGQRPKATMNRTVLEPSSFAVNLSNRQGCYPNFNLGLGGDSWSSDQSMAGSTKLTDFRSWCQIPCLMGQFKFEALKQVGDKIFCVPVNPYHYMLRFKGKKSWDGRIEQINATTNLASIAQQFCHWRGDLVYHFQFFPTKFQSGRVMVVFVPGTEDIDTARWGIKSLSTCQSAIFDINGTMSTLAFRVPWCSDCPYKFNTYLDKELGPENVSDAATQRLKYGIHSSIGKVIVLVYAALASPADVQPWVNCNVHISAENLELMTPTYMHIGLGNMCATTAGGDDSTITNDPSAVQNPPSALEKPDDGVQLRGVPKGAALSMEDPVMMMEKPMTFQQLDHGKAPHKVDHMIIKEYMGRAHYWGRFEHFNQQQNKLYRLWLDIDCSQSKFDTWSGPLRWFFSMIHLFRGPLDIIFVFDGDSNVDGRIWYAPFKVGKQDWSANENAEAFGAPMIDQKVAFGMICFNSAQTPCVKFRVPWCHYLSAISGSMDRYKEDCIHSIVNVQINHFTTADERFRCYVYISIPEEAECMFMRGCPSNELLGYSTHQLSVEEMRKMCAIESSVDPLPPDENEIPSVSPYRDLRIQVGRKRLEEAFKEWRDGNKKKAEKMVSQAGNCFQDGMVVKKNFGSNRIYGIHHSGRVFHPAIAPTILGKGVFSKMGRFLISDPSGWISTESIVNPEQCNKLFRHKIFQEMKFNWNKYVGSDVRECMEISDLKSVSCVMELADFWNLLDVMRVEDVKVVDRLIGDSEVGKNMTDVLGQSTLVLQECQNLIKCLNRGLENLKMSMTNKRYKIARKVIMCVARVSILSYAAYNLQSKAMVALIIGLVGLEVIDSGCDLVELMAESLRKVTDLPSSQSLGLIRDLNASMSLFKNIRDLFGWLVEKLQNLLREKYGLFPTLANLLIENQLEIESLLKEVDDFILEDVNSVTKSDYVVRGDSYLSRLRTLFAVASKADSRDLCAIIRDNLQRLYRKLATLGDVNPLPVHRCEPVVVYLHGARGSGKSLAAMALAVKLCKSLGLDYKQQIYTQAVGSQYWDSYAGQAICLIDDIGQNPNDEDWQYFCQIVSTAPVMLNMADLASKGRSFTSKFIICTSNLSQPQPKTVYHTDAIRRRLHFSVGVKVKGYYSTGGPDGLLDVTLAKTDGSISDLSCIEMTWNGNVISLEDLRRMVLNEQAMKEKNFGDMMEMWAQSATDDLKKALNIKKLQPTGKLASVVEWLQNHRCMVTLSILGVIGCVLGVVGLCHYLKKKNKSDLEDQGVYSGKGIVRRVVKLDKPVESQSVVEKSTLVHRNLARFGIGNDGENVTWRLNCLNVFQDWFLVPCHSYKFEDPYPKYFYLHKDNTFYCQESSRVVVVSLDERFSDVVLMKFPGVPYGRDLREHFVKESDLKSCDGNHGTLCTNNNGIYQMITEGNLKLEERGQYLHHLEDGNTIEITVPGVWRGSGHSARGSCGGALVVANNKMQCPIVGIHIAAGNGALLAKVVTREMLSVVDDVSSQGGRIMEVVVCNNSISINAQTSFRKSVIHDLIERPINYPACMPFKNDVDCLAMMISKFSSEEVDEPDGYAENWELYLEDLRYVFGDVELDLWSQEKAILGDGFLDSIDMSTSAGLPYSEMGLSKREMINLEGKITHPLLATRLSDALMRSFEGKPLNVEFKTCAKDELRKEAKVKSGMTRAIECSPVELVILFRMFFGHFASLMLRRKGFDTGVFVGIDVDTEWDAFVKRAMRFGDYCVNCDFRAFDSSVSTWMIKHCLYLMGDSVGLPWTALNSLYQTLAFPLIRLGRLLLKVKGTVPSGMPGTSLINSMINVVNTIFVLRKVLNCSYFHVRSMFLIATYGDDLVLIPNRNFELPPGFCQLLEHEFSQIGMVVTSTDKGPVRMDPLSQMVFLKRGWRLIDGVVHPLIDKLTVRSMLAWIRVNADFESNIQDACWFMFHYGKEEYEEFVRDLRNKLLLAHVFVKIPTYGQLLDRFSDLELKTWI